MSDDVYDGEIFASVIDGIEYKYRSLTIDEIQKSRQIQDETELEDHYVEIAVISPEINLNKIKAGIISRLAEYIMSVSGILDLESVTTYLEQSRNRTTHDVIAIMKAYVIAAMPAYKTEELDHLSIRQLIDKVVLSEQILTLQQAVSGIESDGVKIHIVAVDEQGKPKSEKKQRKETKEELLRRLRVAERGSVGRDAPGAGQHAALETFDEDTLEKMIGYADPHDPIAAKLFGKK